MANVTFQFENGEKVTVSTMVGENLLETARKSNVVIDAPCSGNGSCGKCRVKLLGGELDSKKTRHISDEEYAEGWRLACCSKVTGDVQIMVPDIASAYRSRMKVADLSSKGEIAIFENVKSDIELAGIELTNSLDVVDVKMSPPSLDDTMPDNADPFREDGCPQPGGYHAGRGASGAGAAGRDRRREGADSLSRAEEAAGRAAGQRF